MSTTIAKTRRIISPLLDRKARIVARERVIGVWKNQYREMIKENKKIRKEWDKRVKKLGR
ncbi:MAG: hypothetical protein AAB605_02570 [Patescibacteria group bacterium]